MNIAIASDHAGFAQKEHLAAYLRSEGYEVFDRGPENDERVDYPDYAAQVAKDLREGRADRGVLLCGTGIGMAIAANRFTGVRAVNATSPDFAALAREHNDANILCLSARFVDEASNKTIIDSFLSTDFAGGRHADRVAKIEEVSKQASSRKDIY